MNAGFLLVLVSGALANTLLGQTPISLGQPVTAGSYQTGNDPSHGNDGDLATRWAAVDSSYPQWWRVDLGSPQSITHVIINWYNSASRACQYRIEISNDDTNYSVLVDNTGNSTFGDTTDTFSALARYVRIYVTGVTPTGGWAGFWECQIYASQTLAITNGIQTYASLVSATVNMSNRCELRITGTNNPVPGCIINLNSPDAWFILQNIRPAAVSASYLAQVRVNGAAAVADSNCRVDQYGMGTVIIPHAPSVAPLRVFSGPNFLGASSLLSLYTYYTNTALGSMNRNIGSFKLKRGYTATFAQNTDGTGASHVYVAQDGDLDIGVMATNLEHQCRFVRVFPWRWTSKKGWGGGDGATTITEPLWWYDWGSSATSTLDREFIPMRWGGSSGTSSINSKQKSTQALGFNEPDRPDQANMSVVSAIAAWPALMQSGLRVGAPAVSDSGVSGQGLDWLYSFMSLATNLGYRVDFVPIHYYKCGWTTSQFSNYLAGVYQKTGLPVWVTEFNNGASWCSSTPTLAQNATAVSNFMNMLESAPFVERYAIYPWFDTTTGLRMVTTNTPNTLTPAGVIYHDKPSALAYSQALPPGGNRSIAQFQFDGTTLDSSGYGNNGSAVGIPGYSAGYRGQALALDGTNSFVRLPPNIANSAGFSFAAWLNWNGGANWQRIFDFGDDTAHYLFLTPRSGSGTLRFAIKNGGSEQIVEAPMLPSNQWCHVAITLSGSTARLYTNGVLAASDTGMTIVPSAFNPNVNYLGKSQFSDPLFSGYLDEVQIADYAFAAAQVAALLTNTPPQFTPSILDRGSATQGQFYSNSIAGAATDPDPGDTLTYTKASGPGWLTVAPDGTLTGTPGFNDVATNTFTVRATDTAGASALAVVTITLPNVFSAGTWNTDASGNWSDTSNWTGNIPANGAGNTADFSTLNISANRTVALDHSRSIGTLKFGDTSAAETWTLTSSNSSVLTLDNASATPPPIAVNQSTATLAVPLAGWNGFTKSGAGTLVLAASNPLRGIVNVDSASNTSSDGIVRVAHPAALANAAAIRIRNNSGTSAASTLQLDGSSGGITFSGDIELSGRNSSVVSIQNVAGTNTLSGDLTINTGGANYWIQSDSGLLTLAGALSSAAAGTRTFTFQGNGDIAISGVLANGNATVNLTKSGAGVLTLLRANTYTGATTINGGRLALGSGVTLPNTSLIQVGAGATLDASASGLTIGSSQALTGTGTVLGSVANSGTLAPGPGIGALTFSNNLALGASSTTSIEIDRSRSTNDQVVCRGTLNCGGTLLVTNLGGTLAAGDSFKLFQAAAWTGAFSSVSLPPLNLGLVWNTAGLVTNGTLSIVRTVATTPTNLACVVSSNRLTLSWPANYVGWRLQAQTNSPNVGLSTNWADVPTSTSTNQMNFPLDPANGSVFYRMVYP